MQTPVGGIFQGEGICFVVVSACVLVSLESLCACVRVYSHVEGGNVFECKYGGCLDSGEEERRMTRKNGM